MTTGGKEGGKQALRVARRDRPVGDTARRRVNLDHRLEPVQPAGTVADDVDGDVAPRGRRANGGVDLIGADRQRCGINGYVEPQRHA